MPKHDEVLSKIMNPEPALPNIPGHDLLGSLGDTDGELQLLAARLRTSVAKTHAEAVEEADALIRDGSARKEVGEIGQRVRGLALIDDCILNATEGLKKG